MATKPKSAATKEAVKKEVTTKPESEVAEEVVVEKEPPAKKIIPKTYDQDEIIVVRNGFQGRLVYQSRKTGELFVWDEFGAEQDMEFGELKNARSSGKNFFVNNWFMFDDPCVVEALGMGQFYKYSLNIDKFDSLFYMDVDEARDLLTKMPKGQKQSVAYRAKQLVSDGAIDSFKMIGMLEEVLGIELIEK